MQPAWREETPWSQQCLLGQKECGFLFRCLPFVSPGQGSFATSRDRMIIHARRFIPVWVGVGGWTGLSRGFCIWWHISCCETCVRRDFTKEESTASSPGGRSNGAGEEPRGESPVCHADVEIRSDRGATTVWRPPVGESSGYEAGPESHCRSGRPGVQPPPGRFVGWPRGTSSGTSVDAAALLTVF